jgi:DNA-binding SARP family transcriptional activator
LSARTTVAGGVLPSFSLGRSFPDRIPPVRLELLSGFSLELDGRDVPLAPGPQRLIALLALQRRPMLREHVAGVLWPDTSTGHAAGSLRSALWRVQQLGEGRVMWTTRSHVGLAQWISVDVTDMVDQAQRLLHASGAVVEPEDLDYRPLTRDLLPDWYEDWVVMERERLRQLRLHALEAVCQRLISLGMFGGAVQAGLAAVAGEPLRESAHRILIEAYLAEGNVAEAIRQFASYRHTLYHELGVDPSPVMDSLMARLKTA